nr:HlyD family efflux transporter periplasmic adaptor subunit [uncultured Solibaculum sp.]
MSKVAVRVGVGLIAVLLIAYVVVQAIMSGNNQVTTEIAYVTEAYDELTVEGMMVRREQILTSDAEGVKSYALADGEKVGYEGTVAYICQDEETAKAHQTIRNLDEQIKMLKEVESANLGGAVSVDSLDKQLSDKLFQLLDVTASRQFSKLEQSKNDLLDLYNRRQLVTGKVENFDARVQQLTQERDALLQKHSEPVSTITAPASGYFYSNIDGYEYAADCDELAKMTKSQVEELLQKPASTEGANAVGKLASEHEWYYVFNLPADSGVGIKAGSQVQLQVPELSPEEIAMTVLAVNAEKDGSCAVVLQSDILSDVLSSLRKQPVTIRFKSYSGIRVSNQAIHFKDNQMGVYIVEGAVAQFAPIEKVYSNGDYMLCKTDTDLQDALQPYDQVIVEGKDLYDGKVVTRQ